MSMLPTEGPPKYSEREVSTVEAALAIKLQIAPPNENSEKAMTRLKKRQAAARLDCRCYVSVLGFR
jgi:hypothetical protein